MERFCTYMWYVTLQIASKVIDLDRIDGSLRDEEFIEAMLRFKSTNTRQAPTLLPHWPTNEDAFLFSTEARHYLLLNQLAFFTVMLALYIISFQRYDRDCLLWQKFKYCHKHSCWWFGLNLPRFLICLTFSCRTLSGHMSHIFSMNLTTIAISYSSKRPFHL